MTLLELENILKSVTPKTYELAAPETEQGSYLVWARQSARPVPGDDSILLVLDVVEIRVVYQLPDDDLEVRTIKALSDANIPCTVVEVGFNGERNRHVTALRVVI